MKSLAMRVSNPKQVLQRFELAEAEEDPNRRRRTAHILLWGERVPQVRAGHALAVLTHPV